MTVQSNKRKAIEFVDGDNKRLATALDDCVQQLVALTKSADERFGKMEERFGKMEERFEKMEERFEKMEERFEKMEEFDRSIEAITKASASEDEEDLSDDEESIVDESDRWTTMFRQLREYRIIHGHCQVTRKENPKLGFWVKNQKFLYKNFKSGQKGQKILPERIIKLDRLGFNWGKNFPPPPSWDEMFEQLHDYQQKMGNCNVPFNATNPNPLAKWAAYQRAEYKRFKNGKDSLLTLDEIGQLKEIGMKWKGPKL